MITNNKEAITLSDKKNNLSYPEKSNQNSTDVTSGSNRKDSLQISDYNLLSQVSMELKKDSQSNNNTNSEATSKATEQFTNQEQDFSKISNTKNNQDGFKTVKTMQFKELDKIVEEFILEDQPVQNKKLVRASSKSNLQENTVKVADDEVGTITQIDQEIFVKRKLRKTQKGWHKFKKQEIKQTRMNGLSNIVYKAEVNIQDTEDLELDDNTVIVRINRKDVVNEVNAFNPYNAQAQNYLESQRIGPKIIHEDKEIKCQKFIRGWQLQKKQMLEQNSRLWMMQPLADFLDNNVNPDDFGGKINQDHLIDDFKVLDILEDRVHFYELQEQEKLTQGDAMKVFDKEEIDFIKDLFKGFDKKDLFLVHGDCYYANCMYSEFLKSLTYIDFEYSCLNPFVSDIANIANESVFDYTVKNYPYYSYTPKKYTSDNDLREMIRALVCFWDNKGLRFKSENADEFESQLRNCKEFYNVDEKVIEHHLLILKKVAIHINFYYVLWTLWDLRNTEIELDYVLYARDRARAYMDSKEKYFKYLKETGSMI